MDFGFIACRDLVPDVWRLADLLQESMDELLTAVCPIHARDVDCYGSMTTFERITENRYGEHPLMVGGVT
ncbi:MAG: WS/DGAT domain-containing protein [Ilumatobacteraceae bacterium]